MKQKSKKYKIQKIGTQVRVWSGSQLLYACEQLTINFGETDACLQEVLDRINWSMSHGFKNPYSIQSVIYQPIKISENET